MDEEKLEWLEQALSWVTLTSRTIFCPDPPELPSSPELHFYTRIECETVCFLGSAGYKAEPLKREAFTHLIDVARQAAKEPDEEGGADTAIGRSYTVLELHAGGGLQADSVSTSTMVLNRCATSSDYPGTWGQLLDALIPILDSVSSTKDREHMAWVRMWFRG